LADVKERTRSARHTGVDMMSADPTAFHPHVSVTLYNAPHTSSSHTDQTSPGSVASSLVRAERSAETWAANRMDSHQRRTSLVGHVHSLHSQHRQGYRDKAEILLTNSIKLLNKFIWIRLEISVNLDTSTAYLKFKKFAKNFTIKILKIRSTVFRIPADRSCVPGFVRIKEKL